MAGAAATGSVCPRSRSSSIRVAAGSARDLIEDRRGGAEWELAAGCLSAAADADLEEAGRVRFVTQLLVLGAEARLLLPAFIATDWSKVSSRRLVPSSACAACLALLVLLLSPPSCIRFKAIVVSSVAAGGLLERPLQLLVMSGKSQCLRGHMM